MCKHAIRVVLIGVVILIPFAFGGIPQSGFSAGAAGTSAAAPKSAKSVLIPAPTAKALTEQPFTLSDGLTGWSTRLPERRPLATPAVSGGHVLIGGGFGSYQFYSFNANTGKLDWQLKTTDDGPTSAVIEDDIGVYNTESCTVEGVDINTGRRLWTHRLGDPLMSQPALSNGRVYMASPATGGSGHTLYCLSLKTGETIWSKDLPADIISAPVVHQGSVYCATIDGTLTRFDAVKGAKVWQQAKNATSAPWIDENGHVAVSQRVVSVDGHKLPVGTTLADAAKLAGKPHKGKQQQIVTNEGFASTSVGGVAEQNALASAPAPYLDATRNSLMPAVAAQKSADASVGFSAAPQSAGMAYANANLGASSVNEVWAYQGSRPIVSAGRNYNVQNNVAQCIDQKTGHTIWKHTVTEDKAHVRTMTPFSEAGGRLYYGTASGEVGCLRKSDGVKLWAYRLSAPVLFAPSIVNGCVYATTEDGCLYCLNTHDPSATGWPMWGGSPAHNGGRG